MNISYSLFPLKSVTSLTPLWSSFSQNKCAQLTEKLWGSAFVTFAFLCFVKHASFFCMFWTCSEQRTANFEIQSPFYFWQATAEQWTTGRKQNIGSFILMQGATFSLSVTEPWNRQPKEAVESSCVEIFKTHLGDLLQATCFSRGRTTLSPEFPSNPCGSANLWFLQARNQGKKILI